MIKKTAVLFFSSLLVLHAGLAAAQPRCQFDANGQQICNPLKANNAIELAINLTRTFLQIIAVVAVVMIVYAGFQRVIAGSNEGAVKASMTTLKNALFGLILALLAYSIVSVVQNVIKSQ